MPTWPVDAAFLAALIAMLRSADLGPEASGGLDDHAPPDFVDPGGFTEFHVVDPPVHTIDDQVDPFAEFVTGKPLGENPADDPLGYESPWRTY